MPYDEVVGWMAGAVPVKRHICMNGLGKEVVTMSEQMPLHPLVKTSCQRFAFQNGKKDASVRISLYVHAVCVRTRAFFAAFVRVVVVVVFSLG